MSAQHAIPLEAGLNAKSLIEQLRQRLTQQASQAARAGADAKDAAQHSATAMEKREDSRTMIEFSNMAFAQKQRVERIKDAIRALDGLLEQGIPSYAHGRGIGLGAIVDAMAEDDDGEYARTFIMLPTGAGEQLHGPGGDGLIWVITPQSPVGKAMMGKKAGDVAEAVIRREPLDWEILEVS